MRTGIFLVLVVAAPGSFAQQLEQGPPKPSDRWTLGVRGFTSTVKPRPKVVERTDQTVVLQDRLQPPCSVPLIRVPVEGGAVIQVLPVPKDFSDGMPKLEVAPVCGESPMGVIDPGMPSSGEFIRKLRELPKQGR